MKPVICKYSTLYNKLHIMMGQVPQPHNCGTLHWRHNKRDAVPPLVQAQIKANTKTPRHWPLWGESTGGFPAQRASDAEHETVCMIYIHFFFRYLQSVAIYGEELFGGRSVVYCGAASYQHGKRQNSTWISGKEQIQLQGWFWMCAQPMADGVTLLRRLS